MVLVSLSLHFFPVEIPLTSLKWKIDHAFLEDIFHALVLLGTFGASRLSFAIDLTNMFFVEKSHMQRLFNNRCTLAGFNELTEKTSRSLLGQSVLSVVLEVEKHGGKSLG